MRLARITVGAVLLETVSLLAAAPRSLSITVVGPDSHDPRWAAVDEAVGFWNQQLADIGAEVRLGPVSRRVRPVPDEALAEMSQAVLGGRRGEWGVFGTHIKDCATGVSMFNNGPMAWYGVMELVNLTSGTNTGFLVDGNVANKPSGIVIGGTINSYELGVTLQGDATNDTVSATVTGTQCTTGVTVSGTSATNNLIEAVLPPSANGGCTTPLSIASTLLPSTLVLTTQNYAGGGTPIGTQIPTDVSIPEEAAPANPASGTRRVYVDSTSHDITSLHSSGATVDLETHGVTTLGDILYANSTPALTRLAGNTFSTPKYLNSTGSGGSATAPTWAQVNFTDLAGSLACSQMPALTGDTTSSAGSCATTMNANRLLAPAGTALTTSNFVISSSWGSGATFSVVTGSTDTRGQVNITASGSGIAANPTVTLTFTGSGWSTAPFVVVGRSDTTTPAATPPGWTISTTTLTITFKGTPASGNTYSFAWIAVG